ncbi:Fumarate reductase flavoprotein subunit precursor [uncultured Clostridium sp.]|uniref:FAD-binding protein n=1 Tax=uncultured Clostridium sp. TaxID=59620 RepID=UPI000822E79B|nr:FAD-binding protein [uncultured Clostridium sp.]SCJ32702.1 Fumarate reductase flavoprotein subunit precursor [uncultured Clostridium sp.]
MKKRLICLLIMSSVVLAGCAKTESGEVTGTPTGVATYEGVGHGYGGEVKVAVQMDGQTITGVEVVEHHETAPVSNRALPIIVDRIVEAKTPVVDSVSGATFTSFAVKSAVADALTQAGVQVEKISMDTKGPEVEKKELEEVKTQLVIVGGGPAGLSAAIEAKENGVEDVILVEKLDILSGNGKFDMNFFDIINTEAQKANGVEDSVEKFIEDKKDSVVDSIERLTAQAEGAAEADSWLRSMGINLNYNYSGRSHMAEADAYAGEHIQDNLEKKVQELGVDVRTGTKGLDLIMEDGKATGIKVESKEGTYDIKADAVIVATGGFSHNKELLAEYAPGAEKLATSNQMGATGDFVSVFKEHDIKMDHMDKLSVFKLIISGRRDLTGAGDGFLLVNKSGERFVDESSASMNVGNAILEQEGGKAFYIYDQRLYDSSYRLKKHNDLGYHVKADTLEELAEKLGVDAEGLKASVEGYNKGVTGESADPFREKPFTETFGSEGPYYGVQVETAIHMTKGGVVADEKAQVISNDGNVVDGLYAAGEVVDTSGAYSASVIFGRISGQEAANHILNK